jgi:hypothetical protein
MATKVAGDSCYAKAAPDEPIFVLRAQDRCAPKAVRMWADFARSQGAPVEKVEEAMDLALEMESWQRTHGAKVPD